MSTANLRNRLLAGTRQQAGFSLVELMVAVLIGSFLIVGALVVFSDSRAAIRVSGQLSQLQENAHFGIQLMEEDARAAGFWGMTNKTDYIAGRAGPADPVTIVVNDDCTINWSVNLDTPVSGSNDANPYGATCIPNGIYAPNTDVVEFRHADETPVATANLVAGQLYIRADEMHAEIFTGPVEPAGFALNAQNFPLLSVAYFVAPDSSSLPGVPSLRRAITSIGGGAPQVVIEEIAPGVEDLQAQFGVDTDADGSVNSYFNADQVVDPQQVMSIRLWVRARAEFPELGFEDDAAFWYADQIYSAAATASNADDPFRRVLVSKTIELRNRRISATSGI